MGSLGAACGLNIPHILKLGAWDSQQINDVAESLEFLTMRAFSPAMGQGPPAPRVAGSQGEGNVEGPFLWHPPWPRKPLPALPAGPCPPELLRVHLLPHLMLQQLRVAGASTAGLCCLRGHWAAEIWGSAVSRAERLTAGLAPCAAAGEPVGPLLQVSGQATPQRANFCQREGLRCL